MKFGISLPNFGKYASRENILKTAVLAEDLGYDSLWVSDHIVIPDSHEGFGHVFLDPITTLGFVAAKTKNISLGTSVLILPYRNPVVLAKMISTLDTLSGGRIIVGAGTGWMRDEFDALGIPFEKRGATTDEYIEVLKELWTRDSPVYKGNYISFSDIKFLPKPLQEPHPPIWIGGGSERAIERAARYGDGWQPVGLTPEGIKEKLGYLNKLLDEEKKDNFVVSLRRNLEINEDKRFPEEETLRGGPEKIITGIRDYIEASVSHFILHILSGDFKDVLKTMETFSTKIRPAI
ncbi:MAG: LLM class F420-dependent oxidoreductase [Deltaproteobacteria bacterium]